MQRQNEGWLLAENWNRRDTVNFAEAIIWIYFKPCGIFPKALSNFALANDDYFFWIKNIEKFCNEEHRKVT